VIIGLFSVGTVHEVGMLGCRQNGGGAGANVVGNVMGWLDIVGTG
jgi:hypothetical protein